jgi:repressor LexA
VTDRQKKYLEFIDNFLKEYGYPPTVREIAKGLGVSSTSGVKRMLDKLAFSGAIKKKENMARGININSITQIPLLGRVKAGIPTLSEENIEKLIDLSSFFKEDNIFFLKAEGDSMIGAGIFDGDYLLVKKLQVLNDNDIGIFRLNGEVTVKSFFKQNERIKLLPANPNYEPIEIKENDAFEIIGKVIILIRSFGIHL